MAVSSWKIPAKIALEMAMETMVGWLLARARGAAKSVEIRNPKNVLNGANVVKDNFANLIIRSVITCYAVWGAVVVSDLASCEARRPGQCEPQRSELRGAATTIPATLLAWLTDSPITAAGSIAQKLIGRKPHQQSDKT